MLNKTNCEGCREKDKSYEELCIRYTGLIQNHKNLVEIIEPIKKELSVLKNVVLQRQKNLGAIHVPNKVSVEEIARLMTQISEEKYHGKAFTYNYIVDVIAKEIHKVIYGDEAQTQG